MIPLEPVLGIALLALFLWLFWVSSRSVGNAASKVAKDRPDFDYCVFTTEFDLERKGEQIVDLLASSGAKLSPPETLQMVALTDRREAFETSYLSAGEVWSKEQPRDLRGYAILLLLDHSGSMADRMPFVAGELMAGIEWIEDAGASIMLAGFTTVGWHGGRSRKKWIDAGHPSYPGRLCDLLHIVYSPFECTTAATDFRPLLRNDVFFENVDGEALLWARGKLKASDRSKRILIVLSDGAPVDDSTIIANGNTFMWRHMMSVLEELHADKDMKLGGIGMDYEMREFYANSRFAKDPSAIAPALAELLNELAP
ncbi:MAG: hypothetical protein AAGL68_09815 [Pseudomonadota bacterium]